MYGSARKSYLKPLDSIHHQGLRLALGAFRTTPIESLYVEANESSLAHRRMQLALQFTFKVKANPSNPVSESIFEPKYIPLFLSKPNSIPTFGIRINSLLEQSNLDPHVSVFQTQIPLWTLSSPDVNLSLQHNVKADTDPLVYHTLFTNILLDHINFSTIFTDGSKSSEGVGCAFIHGNTSSSLHLPTIASIFSAETVAILKALEYIESCSLKKSLIFSDSLSVLQSLKQMNFKNPLILQTLLKLDSLSLEYDIKLIWIPGHIGLSGNEKADRAAKSALDLPLTDFDLPFSDYKPLAASYICTKWQESWDQAIHNKLHTIKPKIGMTKLPSLTRKEQVVITRIRLGHSNLTHSYLFNRGDAPMCYGCDKPFTIHHILTDCAEFSHVRPNYYTFDNIYDIFNNVHPNTILNFLRDIDLYDRF